MLTVDAESHEMARTHGARLAMAPSGSAVQGCTARSVQPVDQAAEVAASSGRLHERASGLHMAEPARLQ